MPDGSLIGQVNGDESDEELKIDDESESDSDLIEMPAITPTMKKIARRQSMWTSFRVREVHEPIFEQEREEDSLKTNSSISLHPESSGEDDDMSKSMNSISGFDMLVMNPTCIQVFEANELALINTSCKQP
jgi:hypothetical protein